MYHYQRCNEKPNRHHKTRWNSESDSNDGRILMSSNLRNATGKSVGFVPTSMQSLLLSLKEKTTELAINDNEKQEVKKPKRKFTNKSPGNGKSSESSEMAYSQQQHILSQELPDMEVTQKKNQSSLEKRPNM